MESTPAPRLWALIGVSLLVILGLALLFITLGYSPNFSVPSSSSVASPLPTSVGNANPIVASVNGYPIYHDFWMEAYRLDQVLSRFSGQVPPTAEETLQRLVNEELVLRLVAGGTTPTTEDVRARIAALEQEWGVDSETVEAALRQAGLSQQVFERTVWRLLSVQAAVDILRGQGEDLDEWLTQQHATADIVISPSTSSLADLPPDLPPALPPPTLTAVPVTPVASAGEQTSVPPPTSTVLIQAVDFTLRRAGGGVLTLTEQLSRGPVALVFFQRCG